MTTASGLIIDPTWAVAERHAGPCTDLRQQRRYFLATGLTLGAGWSGAMAVGALMGARLDWLDLQIFIPLCLLGLVAAGLRAAGGAISDGGRGLGSAGYRRLAGRHRAAGRHRGRMRDRPGQ